MKLTRRTFLKNTGLATLTVAGGCSSLPEPPSRVLVNDIHTALNPTYVSGITKVKSFDELTQTIQRAKRSKRSVCIAGGRHAAGGQQFATDAELIDTRDLRRVLAFDPLLGTIEVEAGIQWPELIAYLIQVQGATPKPWTVAQKQTGTDRLTVGGALSANAHGRGLNLPPIISNVESFVLVNAKGEQLRCSRRENPELFKLAIGGYGMFGFIYSVKLRLVPRRKVQRLVQLVDTEALPATFAGRINEGHLYGDFQFTVDSKADDFLRRGILTCYQPVATDTPLPATRSGIAEELWKTLVFLAHTNPSQAFDLYSNHCLSTSGEVCWSDTQYISEYFDDYHRELDVRLGSKWPATEVLGELYVPRASLPRFLGEAGECLRRHDSTLIYGSVRLIEKDTESFLPWAKNQSACVMLNLDTPHTPNGLKRTAFAFRQLIDLVIQRGGSYYLTYHRYATREQVEACYPQFPEFLKLKLKYDPDERFQSDWYRHYKKLFA